MIASGSVPVEESPSFAVDVADWVVDSDDMVWTEAELAVLLRLRAVLTRAAFSEQEEVGLVGRDLSV